MGLLNHTLEYYPNKNDYQIVCGALYANKQASDIEHCLQQKMRRITINKTGNSTPELSIIISSGNASAAALCLASIQNDFDNALSIEAIIPIPRKLEKAALTIFSEIKIPITILCFESMVPPSYEEKCLHESRGNYVVEIGAHTVPIFNSGKLKTAVSQLSKFDASVCFLLPEPHHNRKDAKYVCHSLNSESDIISLIDMVSSSLQGLDGIAVMKRNDLLETKMNRYSGTLLDGAPAYLYSALLTQKYCFISAAYRGQPIQQNRVEQHYFALSRFKSYLSLSKYADCLFQKNKRQAADALFRYANNVIQSARSIHSTLSAAEQLFYYGIESQHLRAYETEVVEPAFWLASANHWKKESEKRKTQVKERQEKLQTAYDEKCERGLTIKRKNQELKQLKEELRGVKLKYDATNLELFRLKRKLNYCNPKAWIRFLKRHLFNPK